MEHSDRTQKLAPMTEEHPQLFQIFFCKIGKRRQVDAVLDETLGVFAEADALKPVFDPLHCRHQVGPSASLARV